MSKKAAPLAAAVVSTTGVPTARKILIIDDEKDVHHAFRRLLEKEPLVVLCAESGDEGLRTIKQQSVDVIVMDIRMGSQNGLETLKQIRQFNPRQVVIMMTAYGTSQTAIEAMKLGAYDYVLKPFDIPELQQLLARALDAAQAMKEIVVLPTKPVPNESHQTIVGSSPVMQHVYKLVGQVAPTSATVLITGESGTGKELVARAIYQNSTRGNRLFIAINCAAIPDNLLESELFGHERGSFTGAMNQRIGKFELGDGGTIFLDEIGEMPIATQTKILRVLQEGEFSRLGNNEPVKTDVRVIAATNKNLAEAVNKGEFRQDLFYRLNVVSIHLPPLRERLSDVTSLVTYFLQKHRAKHPSGPVQFSEGALDILRAHPWPGNVRELENSIQRAMVFAQGSIIHPMHLPAEVKGSHSPHFSPTLGTLSLGEHDVQSLAAALLEAVAKQADAKALPLIEQALAQAALIRSNGNASAAAKLLGLTSASFKKLLPGS
jgi:DNA-binding NtrC family response regulator